MNAPRLATLGMLALVGCFAPSASVDAVNVEDAPAAVDGSAVDAVGDFDGDAVIDPLDNCPDLGNPTQHDEDADGVGDACDGCPHLADPDQGDTDQDQVGDVCDPGDGAHAITTRLMFDDDGGALAFAAEDGVTWVVANDELTVALDDDGVGLATLAPGRTVVRVDALWTIESFEPLSVNGARNVAIADEVVGAPGSENATLFALHTNLTTPADGANLMGFRIEAGNVATIAGPLPGPDELPIGERQHARYTRNGSNREFSIAGLGTITATGVNHPPGRIGIRARGVTLRLHALVVIEPVGPGIH